LKDLLETIFTQCYDISKLLVVVIDNHSKDNTFDYLSNIVINKQVNVIVAKTSKNIGFAAANNLAFYLLKNILHDIKGKNFILINPDTKIISKRFLKIVEYTLKHLYIVGFSMVSGDNDVIDSIGAYIDYFGNPQDILSKVKIDEKIRKIINSLPLLYYVPYVCFAAVAIKGDLIENIGVLRNDYVIYFEDTEYCLRCWNKNIPVLIYNEFLIWHKRGGTQHDISFPISYDSLDIFHHFTKNSLLLTYEYLGFLKYMIRLSIYLFSSFMFKRKYLIFPIIESIKIILKRRLKPKKLPAGLIIRNPRTWVLLWALKYYLKNRSSFEEALFYGVKRASFEYLRWRFFHKNYIIRK
jgi:GT2 family glycosyltransferase